MELIVLDSQESRIGCSEIGHKIDRQFVSCVEDCRNMPRETEIQNVQFFPRQLAPLDKEGF